MVRTQYECSIAQVVLLADTTWYPTEPLVSLSNSDTNIEFSGGKANDYAKRLALGASEVTNVLFKTLLGAIVINVVVGGERTVSAFTCGRCNNSHAVGALRYHVEMAIADDTAEGTFVWFDGVMMKLHSLRASGLFRCCYATSLSTRVRVTAFNFTEHHKTFTITRIAEELGRAPVDDNGGGDDDDNDVPPGKPTPDEFGSGGAIGDSSKVVKKVCVG
ncbi:unnamed protein product [Brassica rapa subsp. trilocularis]